MASLARATLTVTRRFGLSQTGKVNLFVWCDVSMMVGSRGALDVGDDDLLAFVSARPDGEYRTGAEGDDSRRAAQFFLKRSA